MAGGVAMDANETQRPAEELNARRGRVSRILVVDDERAILDALGYALRSNGFDVDACATGDAALAAVHEYDYDVVVLDLMLPGLSGVEVCRRLRARSAVPIILLSAGSAELDRVLGLEAGADDYVTKPFSMPELVSRVRAILRRRELDRAGEPIRRVGALELDADRHRVSVDGRSVDLTPF